MCPHAQPGCLTRGAPQLNTARQLPYLLTYYTADWGQSEMEMLNNTEEGIQRARGMEAYSASGCRPPARLPARAGGGCMGLLLISVPHPICRGAPSLPTAAASALCTHTRTHTHHARRPSSPKSPPSRKLRDACGIWIRNTRGDVCMSEFSDWSCLAGAAGGAPRMG